MGNYNEHLNFGMPNIREEPQSINQFPQNLTVNWLPPPVEYSCTQDEFCNCDFHRYISSRLSRGNRLPDYNARVQMYALNEMPRAPPIMNLTPNLYTLNHVTEDPTIQNSYYNQGYIVGDGFEQNEWNRSPDVATLNTTASFHRQQEGYEYPQNLSMGRTISSIDKKRTNNAGHKKKDRKVKERLIRKTKKKITLASQSTIQVENVVETPIKRDLTIIKQQLSNKASIKGRWFVVVDIEILVREISFLNRFTDPEQKCYLLIPHHVMKELHARTANKYDKNAKSIYSSLSNQIRFSVAYKGDNVSHWAEGDPAKAYMTCEDWANGNNVILLSDDTIFDIYKNKQRNINVISVSELKYKFDQCPIKEGISAVETRHIIKAEIEPDNEVDVTDSIDARSTNSLTTSSTSSSPSVPLSENMDTMSPRDCRNCGAIGSIQDFVYEQEPFNTIYEHDIKNENDDYYFEE